MKSLKEKLTATWSFVVKKKGFFVAIFVVIISLYFVYGRNRNEDMAKAEILRGQIKEELILSGTLRAKEHAALRFPTSGKLSWIGAAEGDEVVKGQKLAKLDTTSLFADLERAQSDLRDTEAQLAVVYDDVKGNDTDESLTQKESRTTAEVAKDKAYRNLTKARYNLANATLHAPFDGFVTYLAHTYTGVNVLATETQVEVLNPSTIFFDVGADQDEVTDIFEGQRVEVLLDSFDDKKLLGTVERISLTPISGEVGSVYKVEVVFDDQSIDISQFRIGMTGDAHFVLSKKEGVFKVPSSFVNADKDGKYIHLNKPDNKTYIEVGIEGEEETEIIGDFKEGGKVFD